MGAPAPEMNPGMNPADEASAEALLSALRTISAPERRKHASVYNYWLSIKRDREFPPIHDLDPLEISDAGAFSLLLEMIGGGEDAEIRHFGQAIKGGIDVAKVGDAPNPSLLSGIATRLQLVAASRDAVAFEDSFETADGKTRCWVTLLPFSATGTWIDFVYGFVSLDDGTGAAQATSDTAATGGLAEVLQLADTLAEADSELAPSDASDEPEPATEPVEETVQAIETEPEPEPQSEPEPDPEYAEEPPKYGFSAKIFEKLASAGGFYGKPVEMDISAFEVVPSEQPDEPVDCEQVSEPEPEAVDEPVPEPIAEPEPVAEAQIESVAEEPIEASVAEPTAQPTSTSEGALHYKLAEVRAKADEARQAKLRANSALYEGLSAAYDFALDAEDSPEDYLKLVEAEGLKIQLRSPMKPVAKLAFDSMCDEATIKQLEAILAWAFDEELPRGSLAERIETAGGIGRILSGEAKAA